MIEVIEGVVTKEFNEGMLCDIDLCEEDKGYDSLESRLTKYIGKRVRVTIEELGPVA